MKKRNDTWNIRLMVDDSFVPSSKQPSVIYCILTDFKKGWFDQSSWSSNFIWVNCKTQDFSSLKEWFLAGVNNHAISQSVKTIMLWLRWPCLVAMMSYVGFYLIPQYTYLLTYVAWDIQTQRKTDPIHHLFLVWSVRLR